MADYMRCGFFTNVLDLNILISISPLWHGIIESGISLTVLGYQEVEMQQTLKIFQARFSICLPVIQSWHIDLSRPSLILLYAQFFK